MNHEERLEIAKEAFSEYMEAILDIEEAYGVTIEHQNWISILVDDETFNAGDLAEQEMGDFDV